MMKPISQACLRNQAPILEVLITHLNQSASLLEIGSGTGQHAVYCAQQLPDIRWQPSDLLEHHEGMKLWFAEARLENILPVIELDVDKSWPEHEFDHVFTANTVHFISEKSVFNLFSGVSDCLASSGLFFIYGPFNRNGQFTSEGNVQLDHWLKTSVNPLAGIKDFSQVVALAEQFGFSLIEDNALPANNHLLVFNKL
jgi:cyclopropane fatty-acyl-phospholipid synthase-like methyltransferase